MTIRHQRPSISRWSADRRTVKGALQRSTSPVRRRPLRGLLGFVLAGGAILKFAATAAAAGMIWIHLCGSFTEGSGPTWGTLGVARSWTSNLGVTTPFECPPGSAGTNSYGMEVFGGGSNVPDGARAHWEIDAPNGLVIVGAHTEGAGMVSYGVNQNWGGAEVSIGRAEAHRRNPRRSASRPRRCSPRTSDGRSSAAGAVATEPASRVR